jgi:hypothetical protein
MIVWSIALHFAEELTDGVLAMKNPFIGICGIRIEKLAPQDAFFKMLGW